MIIPVNRMSRIKVTQIPQLNTLVIRQYEGRDFFISVPDSIIITVCNLAHLLTFLVMNGYLSHKVLEGILEEYYSSKGDIDGINS